MKKIANAVFGVALLCGLGGVFLKNSAILSAKAENPAIYSEDCTVNVAKTQKNEELNVSAKSAYLMDYGTQTVIFAQNERAHLPIASMCKIMTLLLSFEAIDAGVLDMEEEITVSERAASMGGSQVFLEANAKYLVKELLKSIVVCSANDSCVAMAERLAGSESVFVERMNQRARELGATDTLFANCTGLPKDPQYSCAKDVAIMLKNLLSHEEYYEFGKVWMDKFTHPKGRFTEITNTNKLVRFYEGCDGGKTGFTNEAGFCLAATAKRNDMRVISVVIGAENSKNRFEDVRTMFDYAFANYKMALLAEANVALETPLHVNGGKIKSVSVYPERSVYAFTGIGEKANVSMDIRLNKVKAPIAQGDRIGELIVYRDGVESDRVPLCACERVEKATVWDRFKEIAKNWNG